MEKGLTQGQLATLVDADERTIINIETYKANTTMQVLFPLVKVLGLDPRVIFGSRMAQTILPKMNYWH